VAALSLRIFEKAINSDGRLNRRVAHENDLWDILQEEPNSEMSSFTLRKTVQAHRMLWGNGYIEIQRDGGDRPVALWPRNPARTKVRRASQLMTVRGEIIRPGQLFFATTEGMETAPVDVEDAVNEGYATERPILQADMISMPGLALDGRVGQDVIQLARNAVGLSLATEKFGGKFFGNGALGYGIFKVPTMQPEDFDAFKREVQEAWGGENVNRPLVLQGGEEYQSTSTKPNEGQFLESRQFQISEICRVMGNVPPHMVGVTEKSSRANVEQIGQEFLSFSLAPDLKCWEQEINRKLFPRPTVGRNAGKKFAVQFDTWPLVTPSAADLRAFIQAMVQWGVWSPDDARVRLGDNPLETKAADATWMQINMAPTDQLFSTPALPGAGDDENEDKPPAAADARAGMLVGRICGAYSRLFRDCFGRICARSSVDLKAFRQVFMPVLTSIADEINARAGEMFHAEPSTEELDDSRFMTSYLESMLHRSRNESWAAANGNADAVSKRELLRFVRAMAVESYRSAATAAAKEETEVTPP
jgi:HK97 family phage portal protein